MIATQLLSSVTSLLPPVYRLSSPLPSSMIALCAHNALTMRGRAFLAEKKAATNITFAKQKNKECVQHALFTTSRAALNSRPSPPQSRSLPTATMWQRAVGGCHQPLHVMARLAVVGYHRLTLDRLEHGPRPDGRNELYVGLGGEWARPGPSGRPGELPARCHRRRVPF